MIKLTGQTHEKVTSIWINAGSLQSTREAQVLVKVQLRANLASWVLSKLPKCIHNSISARKKVVIEKQLNENASSGPQSFRWKILFLEFMKWYENVAK